MKKIVSIILTLCMCISFLSVVNVNASSGFLYKANNGEITITGLDGTLSGNIVIPSTIGGYPVTTIGYNAFQLNESIASVVIPDGVTTIEFSAFKFCSNLTSITIPDSVTTIGAGAFINCKKLSSVTLSKNLKKIEGDLFSCTGLQSVVIPDSVTEIGNGAFSGCSKLQSVIARGAMTIGDYSFTNCSALTRIELPEGAKIGKFAFQGCNNVSKIYVPVSTEQNPEVPEEKPKQEEPEVKKDIIRILLNNTFVECDQPPVIVNDRTLVPMRAIFEALGATVSWNAETRTATGVKDGKTVSVTIDKKEIVIDGTPKTIDTSAQIINDHTMVPARAIAEAFDCDVSWNASQKQVIINAKNQQSYRIEAVDKNEEVTATAIFNEKGQLVSITGTKDYLQPFYVHINGNAYGYAQLFERTLYGDIRNISYNSDGTIESAETDNGTFYCEYKGGKLSAVRKSEDEEYYAQYKYSGNVHTSGDHTYTYNENGLLTAHNYEHMFTDTYSYDEKGRLTNNGSNNAGHGVFTFTYDGDKISSATLKQMMNTYTITYRYINE